jgi:hypothetical protein
MQSVRGLFNRLFILSEYIFGQFGPGLMLSASKLTTVLPGSGLNRALLVRTGSRRQFWRHSVPTGLY